MKITDKLFESKFSKKITQVSIPVINKWSSIHANCLKEKVVLYVKLQFVSPFAFFQLLHNGIVYEA